MLATIVVALFLFVGVGRLPAVVLSGLCLLAFVALEPALSGATWGAYVVTVAFLFGAIEWLYPAMLDGVKPLRVMWITPRFTLALAYA